MCIRDSVFAAEVSRAPGVDQVVEAEQFLPGGGGSALYLTRQRGICHKPAPEHERMRDGEALCHFARILRREQVAVITQRRAEPFAGQGVAAGAHGQAVHVPAHARVDGQLTDGIARVDVQQAAEFGLVLDAEPGLYGDCLLYTSRCV